MVGTVTVRLFYRQLVSRVGTTAGQDSRARGLLQTGCQTRTCALWRHFSGRWMPRPKPRPVRSKSAGRPAPLCHASSLDVGVTRHVTSPGRRPVLPFVVGQADHGFVLHADGVQLAVRLGLKDDAHEQAARH